MNAEEDFFQVKNLRVHFPVRGGVFKKAIGACKAVDGVSFSISKGQTVGLVGESGCGKSTLAKSIVQLVKPTAGELFFKGRLLVPGEGLTEYRKSVQMVFQDPAESLNSRMTVGAMVQEPMDIHRIGDKGGRLKRVERLLEQVGLPASSARRYPFEFSGGQRQRIGIARALALNPEFLVLDEPVSALDVSVQSQVLNLLMSLQQDLGLSYLLIAHDLAVVKHISDIIAVMYLGKMVEMGPSSEIYSNPKHAYTQALLSAIPIPDPSLKREKLIIPGDIPSPINPPEGCAYGHRVSATNYQESIQAESVWKKVGVDHWVLECPCCVSPL
ncbi:ABC transporter ATP-binding protein [Opitutales bacterium]|nr:ABC transporter ATP-binding protein [Opitutales bacterium]